MDPSLFPPDVHAIVKALRPARSFVVGGIVRDMARGVLRGGLPTAGQLYRKDWDLATACTPGQTLKRLRRKGFAVLPIGIEHGTVVVHGRDSEGGIDPNRRYEVTTFRHDRICDGRHAEVEFAETLEEDLARRDFTVNALALDPDSGEVLDIQGGLQDLEQRVIRAVGDPWTRFEEDYLRLVRAVRFAVAIEGRIERNTWEALCQCAPGIEGISAERIREEILKMLAYERPSRGFLIMRETGLLSLVLPELDRCFGVQQNRYHLDDVGVHTLLVVDAMSLKYPLLRFIALLHDAGKPPTRSYQDEKADYVFYHHESVGARLARKAMRRLRFSAKEIELAELLTRVHMHQIEPDTTKKTLRRWLNRMGRENFRFFLRLRMADRRGNRRQPAGLEPGLYRAVRMLRQIERDQDALDLSDLAIDGHDLLEMGMKTGPVIGRVLRALLEQVLDDPGLNNKAILLERAREIVNSNNAKSVG